MSNLKELLKKSIKMKIEVEKIDSQIIEQMRNSYFKVLSVNKKSNEKHIGRSYQAYNCYYNDDTNQTLISNENGVIFDINKVEFLTYEEYCNEEDNKVVSLDDFRRKRRNRFVA